MAMYPLLAGALSGASFEEVPLEQAGRIAAGERTASNHQIAVNRISGTMFKHDSCCEKGMRTVAAEMREADADPDVIGHILIIESGGGASNAVPELADTVDALVKPVVAFIDGMACSAAQWAAALCDWTVASRPEDLVGCIGTYVEFHAWRRSGAQDEYGKDVIRIYADGSDRKNEEYEQALEGNFQLIREQVLNPANELFKADMRRRRPAVTDEILRGATYRAADVLGVLVDEIGPMDLAVRKVNELARERGIIDINNQSNNMVEFENITSVAGLEDLQMQADGQVTLNRDQLAAVNAAIGDRSGNDTLRQREAQLEQENTELRGTVAAREARIAELEALIDDGAADKPLELDGKGSGKELSPEETARAYMQEYNKRNSI